MLGVHAQNCLIGERDLNNCEIIDLNHKHLKDVLEISYINEAFYTHVQAN